MGKNTLIYSAAVMWNNLPSSLKLVRSENILKVAFKSWFLRNIQTDIHDEGSSEHTDHDTSLLYNCWHVF